MMKSWYVDDHPMVVRWLAYTSSTNWWGEFRHGWEERKTGVKFVTMLPAPPTHPQTTTTVVFGRSLNCLRTFGDF